MDVLGRIISDVSQYQIRLPRQPSRGDEVPACVPVATHRSFQHSHLVAFSAASLMDFMALFLAARLRTLHRENPAKPQQPTSIVECSSAPAPKLLNSSTSSWYWAYFLSLASLIRSSQGTVSSSMISCFKDSEMIIMSHWRDVVATCWGTSVLSSGQCTAANEELCRGGLCFLRTSPRSFWRRGFLSLECNAIYWCWWLWLYSEQWHNYDRRHYTIP